MGSSILAVDIGNTNVVLCVHDGNNWGDVIRIKTKSSTAVDEVRHHLRLMSFGRAVVSSVVPDLTHPVIKAVREAGGIEPVVVGLDIETGLKRESIPPELGADILCNLIAAHSLYPDDYVTVADFGTAFTTETVSPQGEVLGVTIGPGMMTSVKALFESAAQIPAIRLDLPTTVLGRDTVTSIRAGVIYGFVGQLRSIVDQIEQEIGHKVVVIVTGGFSVYLEGKIYVNRADVRHTLEGARIACELNS